MSQGIPVAAVEILHDVQMRSINKAGLTKRVWDKQQTLFFMSFIFGTEDDEKEELWSARRAALWSMMALRKDPSDKVWTTDVAVSLSRVADIIGDTKEDIKRSGLTGSIVGHVGDGNLHTLLLISEADRAVADGLVHRMVENALKMGGTATGEHGVGMVKRDYLELELGKATVDLMRKMKTALDPLRILNCDKVVRMEAEQ